MSKKKVIIIIGSVVIAAAGAVWVTVNRRQKELANAHSGIPTAVEKSYKDTIVTKVTAKGEVVLLNTELVYSDTEAAVAEVLVEKNEAVKKGQPLIRYSQKDLDRLQDQLKSAELDLQNSILQLENAKLPAKNSDIKAAENNISSCEQGIREAQSNLEQHYINIDQSKINLADAQKRYDQEKHLLETGISTQDAFDSANIQLENAKSQLSSLETQTQNRIDSIKMAENNLKLAQTRYNEIVNQLSDPGTKNLIAQLNVAVERNRIRVNEITKDINTFQTEIASPIDGTVIKVSVSEGEVTPTEKVLMEIANLNDYVVRLNIKEREAPSIRMGQEVEIEGSVLGKEKCIGTVTKIEPIAETVQNNTGTEKVVPVEVTMNQDAAALKPGYSMEATIVTNTVENVVVPIMSTLSDKEGHQYVLIVNDKNEIEKKKIELGAFSDLYVEAIGLEEGAVVVSQPTEDLAEGTLVSPVGLETEDSEGEEK